MNDYSRLDLLVTSFNKLAASPPYKRDSQGNIFEVYSWSMAADLIGRNVNDMTSSLRMIDTLFDSSEELSGEELVDFDLSSE